MLFVVCLYKGIVKFGWVVIIDVVCYEIKYYRGKSFNFFVFLWLLGWFLKGYWEGYFVIFDLIESLGFMFRIFF